MPFDLPISDHVRFVNGIQLRKLGQHCFPTAVCNHCDREQFKCYIRFVLFGDHLCSSMLCGNVQRTQWLQIGATFILYASLRKRPSRAILIYRTMKTISSAVSANAFSEMYNVKYVPSQCGERLLSTLAH